jgi:hypothetical protein
LFPLLRKDQLVEWAYSRTIDPVFLEKNESLDLR